MSATTQSFSNLYYNRSFSRNVIPYTSFSNITTILFQYYKNYSDRQLYNDILRYFIILDKQIEIFISNLANPFHYQYILIDDEYEPNKDEIKLYGYVNNFRFILKRTNKQLYRLLFNPFLRNTLGYQIIYKLDIIYNNLSEYKIE